MVLIYYEYDLTRTLFYKDVGVVGKTMREKKIERHFRTAYHDLKKHTILRYV